MQIEACRGVEINLSKTIDTPPVRQAKTQFKDKLVRPTRTRDRRDWTQEENNAFEQAAIKYGKNL